MRFGTGRKTGPVAAAVVLLALVTTTGCGRQSKPGESTASEPPSLDDPGSSIRRVLAEDAELGSVRNHGSETGTLASAVDAYVKALEEVDFSGCPEDFENAFARHREAWRRCP